MEPLPQIAPISALKHKHLDVFKQLKNGPVVLASRSQPVGVLLAPAQWNALAERLEDLEATVTALEAELALAHGEETVEEIDLEELKAQAGHATVASGLD